VAQGHCGPCGRHQSTARQQTCQWASHPLAWRDARQLLPHGTALREFQSHPSAEHDGRTDGGHDSSRGHGGNCTGASRRRYRNPSPLNVFLSHAKLDGTQIAEAIRDGVRSFSQLVAWYDANDLPFGAKWESPMVKAAQDGTAAMVVTVTDAYPTRPWCRREAGLARTPVRLNESAECRVWKVQPVVAVHQPKSAWVRGVPMLEGVPRIGWNEQSGGYQVEQIVDRLVLEVLLANVHRQAALGIDGCVNRSDSCYITWVPDAWTLAALRQQMERKGLQPSTVRRIVYPGYGLTVAETAELEPVFSTFHAATNLVSFEEAWQ
jgi:hypothetical protein